MHSDHTRRLEQLICSTSYTPVHSGEMAHPFGQVPEVDLAIVTVNRDVNVHICTVRDEYGAAHDRKSEVPLWVSESLRGCPNAWDLEFLSGGEVGRAATCRDCRDATPENLGPHFSLSFDILLGIHLPLLKKYDQVVHSPVHEPVLLREFSRSRLYSAKRRLRQPYRRGLQRKRPAR